MGRARSYGVLSRLSEDQLEFVVDGRVQRTWKVEPPLHTLAALLDRCLVTLGNEGWRPISHESSPVETVVLARVPYAAGTKLSTHGTLRYLEDGTLVLTVAGSVMQRWNGRSADDLMSDALAELERHGWRVVRIYPSGATVVRG